MNDPGRHTMPRRFTDSDEADYSDPSGDDFEALSRDRVIVRALTEGDLAGLVRIDGKITGRDRADYFESRIAEALLLSGIRVSAVAEEDGQIAGFIMARIDYGEFGHTEPEAVIDTIGVDPAYAHHHIGSALMSQLLANLAALRVDDVRTELEWDNLDLLAFLGHCGFRPSQRLALSKRIVEA